MPTERLDAFEITHPDRVSKYRLELWKRVPISTGNTDRLIITVARQGHPSWSDMVYDSRYRMHMISTGSSYQTFFGRANPSPEYAARSLMDIYVPPTGLPIQEWVAVESGAQLISNTGGERTGAPELLRLLTMAYEEGQIAWAPCGICGSEACSNNHVYCAVCNNPVARENSTVFNYYRQSSGVERERVATELVTERICGFHGAMDIRNGGFMNCSVCARWGNASLRHEDGVCQPCLGQTTLLPCCGRRVRQEEDEFVVHTLTGRCTACSTSRWYNGIHEWDYRPALIFHPPIPERNGLYIGMELEVSFPEDGRSRDRSKVWRGQLNPDLIYVKSDSSVSNGYEVVTHPFQPEWGLNHFPFDMFEILKQEYNVLETHPTAGTHIHFSKDAFTTAGLWKFMQIHYRLPEFCRLVGGREDGTYSSFGHEDMVLQRERAAEIAKKKGHPTEDFDRYVAVNLRNEFTIELRYMRSGPWPEEIKKNIEWADALYKFSDALTVAEVRGGMLDDAGYFLWWINQGNYPNLQEWIQRRSVQPKVMKGRV